jgi:hypothetical protein
MVFGKVAIVIGSGTRRAGSPAPLVPSPPALCLDDLRFEGGMLALASRVLLARSCFSPADQDVSFPGNRTDWAAPRFRLS